MKHDRTYRAFLSRRSVLPNAHSYVIQIYQCVSKCKNSRKFASVHFLTIEVLTIEVEWEWIRGWPRDILGRMVLEWRLEYFTNRCRAHSTWCFVKDRTNIAHARDRPLHNIETFRYRAGQTIPARRATRVGQVELFTELKAGLKDGLYWTLSIC